MNKMTEHYAETATPWEGLSLKDRVLLKIIDGLNRRGSHTNPQHIHKNIETFLMSLSDEFIDLLPENAQGLDIGAGKGMMSKVLLPRKTYNLDINPPSDGFQPQIKGRAEELPFENERFDYALFLYSLNHFENPRTAICESNRVLKHGGYLIAMVESLRFPGQERFVHLNEISMERIIFGETNKPYSARNENYVPKEEFEGLTASLRFEPIIKKDFKPTRSLDMLFKTQKSLYVMRKPS